MSEENCTHDCSTCSQNCSSRNEGAQESLLAAPHPMSSIKHVIGVMSGKGGVGKSLVSSLIASGLQKQGYKCGILDADITGPSIPKVFGIHERAMGNQDGFFPVESKCGVKVMSINLLLDNEADPVIWRGPVLAGVVKQFWQDVIWQDIDYLIVDMPPGTGDVPLTVFQSIPLDGVIVVTSPQDLVSMIVKKAVKMAALLDLPILGVVENMSYVECPECGNYIHLFGESHITEVLAENSLELLAQMPIDPQIASLCDSGEVYNVDAPYLKDALEKIKSL